MGTAAAPANHIGGGLNLNLSSNFMFRSDNNNMMGYSDMMEKRQLFLRSYQFSRKKSMGERIKGSFFRVKRVICIRLRSAKKIRKAVWLRIRYGLFYNTRRRKFFLRLHSNNNDNNHHRSSSVFSWPSSSSSSCFW
ncbi:hypothetical protein M9H77_27065 [Catharanthus roseus]|uniref:Uncharacterized protein n=1 Tax=Catharanthus roseus TaxID=4058 RepID=A0ACC0ABF6_CATRO|nr:hypothetical protein M9H77_27065 [Catharanthus roseus]